MDLNDERFSMAVSVGKNFANIYVSEYFEDIDRTVVNIFFKHRDVEYKHFTFVLAKGKTRVTLTDLGAGTYTCYATQFSGDGRVTAQISFTVPDIYPVDTGFDTANLERILEEIRDRLPEKR